MAQCIPRSHARKLSIIPLAQRADNGAGSAAVAVAVATGRSKGPEELDLGLASFYKRKIHDLEADCCAGLNRIRSRFAEGAFEAGRPDEAGAGLQESYEFDLKFVDDV